MPLPALFTLAAEFREVWEALADMPHDDPAYLDTLEGVRLPLEAKSYNVACFVRTLESVADMQTNAAKELAAKAAATTKRADKLRDYLAVNMRTAGVTRIDAAPDRPAFSLSFRKNPASVVIHDASLLPSDYMRQPEPPPPAPDKKLIAQAIKDGYTVPGCELVQAERLHIG